MVSSNTLVPAGVPSATRRGSDPLLSRMRHSSTSGRYTRTRLLRLRSNRRRTSAAGTSWPPLRTRSRTRRTATSAEGSQRYTFGTRVCGSQQLRQPGRVGMNSSVWNSGRCRGSQSRPPFQSKQAGLVTKSRAAPRPIFPIEHQFRFRRIVFNVTYGLRTGRPLPFAEDEVAQTGIVRRSGTTFGRQTHTAHSAEVLRSAQAFGARVCDSQQLRQPGRVGMNSSVWNCGRCCGSQSRAPEHDSARCGYFGRVERTPLSDSNRFQPTGSHRTSIEELPFLEHESVTRSSFASRDAWE